MSGVIGHLLDTNVVIGLLKGHPSALVLAEGARLAPGRFGISQITRMELLGYPGLNDSEEDAVRRWLALCHVLPIDDATEARAIAFAAPRSAAPARCHRRRDRAGAGAHLLTLDEKLSRVFADAVAGSI